MKTTRRRDTRQIALTSLTFPHAERSMSNVKVVQKCVKLSCREGFSAFGAIATSRAFHAELG